MADDFILLKIEGIEKLQQALQRFPKETNKYFYLAGQKATKDVVLKTVGLQKYPPSTAANSPGRIKAVTFSGGRTAYFRMPYYKRGVGTQIPVRGGGWRSLNNSERMGRQWYTHRVPFGVEIGNRASYAKWVHGKDTQAKAMQRIGWRKLYDVAIDNLSRIRIVYQEYTDELLRVVGLK